MHRSALTTLTLTLILAQGCSSDVQGEDTQDTGTTAAPTATANAVPLNVTVGDFFSLAGVEGLDVCLAGTDTCTATNSEGTATLMVSPDADVPVTIEGGDYTPTLLPYRTDADGQDASIYLGPVTLLETVLADLSPDLAKSQVTITLNDGEGYTATLDSGEQVHYWNDIGAALDLDLTSTSASGQLAAVNLTGDSVTVTLDGPGECTSREHYSSAGPNVIVLPLQAGFFSGITLDCE